MDAGAKIQSHPATMGLPIGGFLRIFQSLSHSFMTSTLSALQAPMFLLVSFMQKEIFLFLSGD